MDLSKVKISASPLTGEIYIFRHGKDATLALDKRNAEAELFSALVVHMLFDAPNGAVKKVSFGEKQFEITVKPTPNHANSADQKKRCPVCDGDGDDWQLPCLECNP